MELVEKAGAYIGWVLGKAPADLAGVLGGDWLAQVRIRSLARYKERTEEILKARGVTDATPVSPSLAVPLLRAAADETVGSFRSCGRGSSPLRWTLSGQIRCGDPSSTRLPP